MECFSFNKNGEPCKNSPLKNTNFCWQHTYAFIHTTSNIEDIIESGALLSQKYLEEKHMGYSDIGENIKNVISSEYDNYVFLNLLIPLIDDEGQRLGYSWTAGKAEIDYDVHIFYDISILNNELSHWCDEWRYGNFKEKYCEYYDTKLTPYLNVKKWAKKLQKHSIYDYLYPNDYVKMTTNELIVKNKLNNKHIKCIYVPDQIRWKYLSEKYPEFIWVNTPPYPSRPEPPLKYKYIRIFQQLSIRFPNESLESLIEKVINRFPKDETIIREVAKNFDN